LRLSFIGHPFKFKNNIEDKFASSLGNVMIKVFFKSTSYTFIYSLDIVHLVTYLQLMALLDLSWYFS